MSYPSREIEIEFFSCPIQNNVQVRESAVVGDWGVAGRERFASLRALRIYIPSHRASGFCNLALQNHRRTNIERQLRRHPQTPPPPRTRMRRERRP